MATASAEQDWVDLIRNKVLGGDLAAAQSILAQALAEHPASADLRRVQAGVFQQAGQHAAAEQALRGLLAQHPDDAGSAFALARMLKERGRMAAAASTLRACFAATPNAGNAELAISAIELLDGCDRKADAAVIAEDAIVANPTDARLHVYAGMLAIQLGQFERARARYLFAFGHDPRALEWHVAIGLSSTLRYGDPAHPDFAVFRDALARTDLSDLARAELHFALGKAHDDLGDYAQAARHFREGNAIRRRNTKWSRKAWRRIVEARLATKPITPLHDATEGFTPVFIVGMPRTGTTLLAELLSRYPNVCNRGELPTLARLAQQPDLGGTPNREALRRAADTYARHARQDDAPDARWFIDKQPLNFRYVDLALAMFPDARIVHCTRNPRDTALSLWMQCFLEDVQGYSYDFGGIALVMRDERRLMAHWRAAYPGSIRTLRYEDVVASPTETIAQLAKWIGLPPTVASPSTEVPTAAISTASLWQARQPVNARSVGRSQHYAEAVPELLRFPADAAGALHSAR